MVPFAFLAVLHHVRGAGRTAPSERRGHHLHLCADATSPRAAGSESCFRRNGSFCLPCCFAPRSRRRPHGTLRAPGAIPSPRTRPHSSRDGSACTCTPILHQHRMPVSFNSRWCFGCLRQRSAGLSISISCENDRSAAGRPLSPHPVVTLIGNTTIWRSLSLSPSSFSSNYLLIRCQLVGEGRPCTVKASHGSQ
ncbi:hypothetical protein DFJ74DRAFT_84200 [Hyaloraphidium curvatum]|nr:hypothetical protein DFJ74DRAFT_84200 [Hyaloraphidium curvatum]